MKTRDGQRRNEGSNIRLQQMILIKYTQVFSMLLELNESRDEKKANVAVGLVSHVQASRQGRHNIYKQFGSTAAGLLLSACSILLSDSLDPRFPFSWPWSSGRPSAND